MKNGVFLKDIPTLCGFDFSQSFFLHVKHTRRIVAALLLIFVFASNFLQRSQSLTHNHNTSDSIRKGHKDILQDI